MATSIITSLNPNIRPSIIYFGGWAFVIDGYNDPYLMDQNQAFKWWYKAPTTAITANESAAGSMSGVYKYLYTEFNKTSGDGTMFYGLESTASAIYTTGTLSSKKVTLTLPGTATNTSGGITHLKIYRTDAGGSTAYYYIGFVAIGTTSFEDNAIVGDTTQPSGKLTTLSDGSVTRTELNYPVTNFKYAFATKTRIVTFGNRVISDGTVSVTNGSATVTGSSTLFTQGCVGKIFYINNESRGYVVSTVASATSLTLAENYAGTTKSTQTYTLELDNALVKWSAKNPLTAKPMWWAFPTDFYRYLRYQDDSPFMGGACIGDQAVIFKQRSHYLLTESGDDFIPVESNTKIGLASNWTLANDIDDGTLIFLSYDGKLYKTNGLNAVDLNCNLMLHTDGINMANAERCQAVWYGQKSWYMMIYPSLSYSGSGCDRMLVWDKRTGQWVIHKIYANCIHIIEDTESGQAIKKPWIGTIGGFVYKLLTGNNFGASSGTLTGTSTAIGTATVTDSGASFYTTGDGLKDVYVSLFDTTGAFKESQKISSNTGTIITVDTNWTTSPVAGWTYEIGSIIWSWKSKIFDFGTDLSKNIRNCIMNYNHVASARNVTVNFYFSDDVTMSSTQTFSMTFDLSKDYYEKPSCYDNRFRYFQFEITGHGTNDPVVINNIAFDIVGYNR